MNWRAALAIARKDVVDALRNQYIVAILALPVILSLLLPVIFPSPGDELETLRVVVYDPGGSRLVTWLSALPNLQLIRVDAGARVTETIEAENAVAGLGVPADFDAAVAAGERPALTIYVNQGEARGGQDSLARWLEQDWFRRLIEQQVAILAGPPPPVNVVWVDVGAASTSRAAVDFDLDQFMLVMILGMALAMVGVYMVPLLIVEEKERHTLAFLLVSPADAGEVALGKALPGIVYSLAIAAMTIALNQGWAGDFPVTILALLLGSLFTVAVGLLIGSFLSSTMQVNTWGSAVIVLLLLPSWVAPGQRLPALAEAVMRLIPTTYLVQALQQSLAGRAALPQVWTELAILSGAVLLAFGAVVWTLRREEV